MLKETFKKLGETLATFREETRHLTQGQLTVRITNGNIEIVGPMKELRINGKLVRFTEGRK